MNRIKLVSQAFSNAKFHLVGDRQGIFLASAILFIHLFHTISFYNVVLFPHLHRGDLSITVLITYGICCLLTIVSFVRAIFSHPGPVKLTELDEVVWKVNSLYLENEKLDQQTILHYWECIRSLLQNSELKQMMYFKIRDDVNTEKNEKKNDEMMRKEENDLNFEKCLDWCDKYVGNDRYCRECRLLKGYQIHHCRRCQHCVSRLDHHCPYINNCVGANNHWCFTLLLYYTFVQTLFAFIISMLHFWHWVSDQEESHIFLMQHREFIYILVLVNLILLVMITSLSFVQTCNICKGVTVLQAMSHRQRNYQSNNLSMLKRFQLVFGETRFCNWFNPFRFHKMIMPTPVFTLPVQQTV
ncbi:hypothetical protein SNEBB_001761 [Seison nebaliae]|nr:hypothetical protein SNEBB_001761 [Seison nebaliae]